MFIHMCFHQSTTFSKRAELEEAKAAQDSTQASELYSNTAILTQLLKKQLQCFGYPVGNCRRPFNYLCDEGVEALAKVLKENADKGIN